MALSKVALIFCQISRLQYCFENKQIHSKQYGYPQYLFYILYIIGGVLAIVAFVITQFLLQNLYIKDNICYAESNFDYFVFNAIGILIFCLWDWTVIILYAIKVHQIKKEKNKFTYKK